MKAELRNRGGENGLNTEADKREKERALQREEREGGEREAEGERGRKDVLMRGRARLVCLPPQHEERAVNEG